MADAALAQLKSANSRAVTGNVGRMTDEQLIALRSLFQAIDRHNNGSITPSLLNEFYQEEEVTIDIRGVEDLFDTVGAEHSLPFRRFLVFAPSFVAKLPTDSKWRSHDLTAVAEAGPASSEPKDGAKQALQATHSALNRQIVEAQSRLDRILEEIATGESTLAAIHLKIHAAEQDLQQLETQVSEKATQLDAYNLVQPVRAKTPAHTAPPLAATSKNADDTAEAVDTKAETVEENDDSASDSESDSDAAPLASPNSDIHEKPESVGETVATATETAETDKHEKSDEKAVEPVQEVSTATLESPKSVNDTSDSIESPKLVVHPDTEVATAAAVELDSTEKSVDPVTKSEPEKDVQEVVEVNPEPEVKLEVSEKSTEKNVDHEPSSDGTVTASTSVADTSEEASAIDTVTPKKRRKHRESQVALLSDNSGSTESLSPSGTPRDKRDKKVRSKDKREKSSKRDKDKDKTRTKEKRRKTSTVGSATPDQIVNSSSSRSLNDSVEVQLEEAPLNQSAMGIDPLRTAQAGTTTSPVRSPRTPTKVSSPTSGISFPSNVPENDLPGEKIALIDKTFFASIDVKLQAIIDGLQPHQHILDLSYFNLVVYIQGLNASLTNVATKLPNASTVPQHLLAPQTTKKPSVVQLQPRMSAKASVIGMASVQISPSSPTPPTTTTVRTPLLGHLVSGPYFAMATGDMINSLGDTLVQCLNNLLISIQDSRSKSPSLLAALCSSWKAQLYRAICTAYHSMCNLIKGVTSDLAQYFFPAMAPPADDPTLDRGLNSVYNQISMPPTNVNDDYLPDPVALEILSSHQATDSQLITRDEFVRLFSVYFGEGVMEHMLYVLDPWATHNIPIKRFAEFLRLFGTVVGASCFRQFQAITETPGFQGYLTESVALTLLEQQKPGTFCLWYNKVRPKFGVLNLSWFDDNKEIVSSTTITISSTPSSSSEGVPSFNFGFDFDGLSVSAPTLQELIQTLCSTQIEGSPLLTKPYTPQFARSSVFHGDMDSPEAEALLAKETDGTLLFRLSSRKGSLAVSYVFRGKVGHTLLKIGSPDCYEYSGQVYNSVEGVIQGHAQIFKYIFDSSYLTRMPNAQPKVYL
jgi:hypothetical protein